MKLRIIINILLSLVVLAGAALLAQWLIRHFRQPGQKTSQKVIPKVLAPVIEPRLNYRVIVVGYGSAEPKIQVDITPQVTGIVVEKSDNFISGKYISEGQLLCRIEETDYELAIERVEKNVELLKAELQRLEQEQQNLQESLQIEIQRRDLAQSQVEKVRRLLERKAASDNELDLAKEALLVRKAQLQYIRNQLALIGPERVQLQAQMSSAKVELKQAQMSLARCVIKSPVSGRVLNCNIEVGEQALAGNSCGQIYGTDIMEVPVSIAYSDLEWIETGLLNVDGSNNPSRVGRYIEANVELQQQDNRPAMSWLGRIDRIEAGLDAETRTAGLIVQVKNPRPKGISSGRADNGSATNTDKAMLEKNMFCKVTIVGKMLDEVYVLPRRAVLPDNSVYLVVEGKLTKRAVTVARFAGEKAMILPGNGIRQGERAVIGSIAKPVIGMSVKAVDE